MFPLLIAVSLSLMNLKQISTLTEEKTLQLVVSGVANKVISRRLNVSRRTVDRLRARVFDKLGVDSAIAAARLVGEYRAHETGLHRMDSPDGHAPAGRRLRTVRARNVDRER